MTVDPDFVTTDCQELFDLVVQRLAAQGIRSVVMNRKGSTCAYQTPEGLRCAAGHAMTPTLLEKISKNGYSYSNLDAVLSAFDLSRRVDRSFKLQLSHLQKQHDTAKSRAELASGLRTVALEHRLEPAAVTTHMTQDWQEAGAWKEKNDGVVDQD